MAVDVQTHAHRHGLTGQRFVCAGRVRVCVPICRHNYSQSFPHSPSRLLRAAQISSVCYAGLLRAAQISSVCYTGRLRAAQISSVCYAGLLRAAQISSVCYAGLLRAIATKCHAICDFCDAGFTPVVIFRE